MKTKLLSKTKSRTNACLRDNKKAVSKTTLFETLFLIMKEQTIPYLILEKKEPILDCVIQRWQLANDFRAYLQIHDDGFASVYLLSPKKVSNIMSEAEKILPFFEGLDVNTEPCIDGKAFKVRANDLTAFLERFNGIILTKRLDSL